MNRPETPEEIWEFVQKARGSAAAASPGPWHYTNHVVHTGAPDRVIV